MNDGKEGLAKLAADLAAIDRNLPWHLNGFVPRYQMKDRRALSTPILKAAAQLAYATGLRYVYVGNVADRLIELSHTRCPQCHLTVVQRANYTTRRMTLDNGQCPRCATMIPGRWT